jgi:hypothetical protein
MALAVYAESKTLEKPAAKQENRQSFIPASPNERPAEGIFILPGGYVDDNGISHDEVELAPVTGEEEEFLASLPANVSSVSVATGLLSRCVKRIGAIQRINAALVSDLLVGDRDYLILKLYETAFGQKVDVILRCPNSACGKPMEVALFLDQLPVERKRVTQRFFTMQLSPAAAYRNGNGLDQRLVEFRLPTGADQEAVAAMVNGNEIAAIHHLLARCIRRLGPCTDIDAAFIAELSPLACDEIEKEMQKLAPQVEIELEAICPECQTALAAPFDFFGFLCAEMKNHLGMLQREVHFLAWHYHWPEKEILSMTRKKRRRYIELLQEELERFNQR